MFLEATSDSWPLRCEISQTLHRCVCMLFIPLHPSCCLLNSDFDSRRKDHFVLPRFLICADNSIFAECWCLFCPGISRYYCKTSCHQAPLWWMTKVAAILFKGKQETYEKLLKKWENNVQFHTVWQSDLLSPAHTSWEREWKNPSSIFEWLITSPPVRPFMWSDEIIGS